jgi:uncharacterized protein involved in type VI secretion and phage assembly
VPPISGADAAQAQRYADIQMEAREARSQLWRGRSTVRTLRASTRLTVTGAPADAGPGGCLTAARCRQMKLKDFSDFERDERIPTLS